MGRPLKVDDTVPVPFGRPRTAKGDLAANMQIGQSVLFDNEKDADRFRHCIRWYHGNSSVSVRKVPRVGWRVWRTK